MTWLRRLSSISYQVGDTWQYTAPNGDVGRVWLSEKLLYGKEVWMWSFCHSDGSGKRHDWAPSKRTVTEQCSVCFAYYRGYQKPRFTRVKLNESKD